MRVGLGTQQKTLRSWFADDLRFYSISILTGVACGCFLLIGFNNFLIASNMAFVLGYIVPLSFGFILILLVCTCGLIAANGIKAILKRLLIYSALLYSLHLCLLTPGATPEQRILGWVYSAMIPSDCKNSDIACFDYATNVRTEGISMQPGYHECYILNVSPNNGADIINSIDSDRLDQFVIDHVIKLSPIKNDYNIRSKLSISVISRRLIYLICGLHLT